MSNGDNKTPVYNDFETAHSISVKTMDLESVYSRLDHAAAHGEDVYAILREQPVDAVAKILSDIPHDYPRAKAALPSMAEDSVQLLWTGAAGDHLLMQSCAFVRAVETGYLKYIGRSLQDRVVLDYGCGWGRLIRLMYKFTSPENIHACDPSHHSIEQCRQHQLAANFSLCSPIPSGTPFSDVRFDLIYAFSVFTHLSERTASAVIAACRSAISDNGLLAITIRPPGYWKIHDQNQNRLDPDDMWQMHHDRGYAFKPHSSAQPFDGEITYGDTSIALSYIRERWIDWSIQGIDMSITDPYQTIVFLKPRLASFGG